MGEGIRKESGKICRVWICGLPGTAFLKGDTHNHAVEHTLQRGNGGFQFMGRGRRKSTFAASALLARLFVAIASLTT